MELSTNPNTVQKAYRLLEEEGLMQSHAGAKSYMSLAPDRVERIRAELLENDARAIVAAMRQMGLNREEAIALIGRYWE